ncbi:MAG: dihydroorotase [Chloroflexota bacterium]
MKSLLIKDGRLLDPGRGIDEIGNLLVRDDRIATSGQMDIIPPDTTVFNASGLVVAPGFIDLHCHLRDPGFPEKETIATGSRAAARGGFTTICCMPNTSPPLDNKAMIDYVKSTAGTQSAIRVLPIGCITRGRAGKELANLEELVCSGVIGVSDDGSPVMNSLIMRQALEFSRSASLPIMEHAEDINLSANGQMNEGALAASLKLHGIPNEAEEIIVARDLLLSKLTGGWLHICHVSTKGSVELIRWAKEKNIKVTCEVTPHHLTMTEEMVQGLNADAKVNPPLRTAEDIKALISGLKEGIIDVIATDHAPHTEKEKASGFTAAPSGISVFETALGSLMSLVHKNELTMPDLIARLTTEPAKMLGNKFGKLGTLAVGAEADITIFDPNKEWPVETRDFLSRGKNTPLAGATLRGKVIATIARGEIVFRDSSVNLDTKGISR